MSKWKPNLGEQPRGTKNKRVKVRLRNGMEPPESWAADGKGGCCWEREGSDFDIMYWMLAG